MSRRPPRLAEWLLLRGLDADAAESVAGDLAEEFEATTERRGRLVASMRYWRQAISSVVVCRVTGQRLADARWMDVGAGAATVRDRLRLSLRQFRDHPVHVGTCVVTLALAVGVVSASYAIVTHALLDPLPYARDESLVSVMTASEGDTSAVSAHVLQELQASGAPLDDWAPVRPTAVTIRHDDGSETIGANVVTDAYFHLLGVQPAIGRTLLPGERDAVVVAWSYWQRVLGADPAALGRRILVNDTPLTVVGVLPAGFMPIYWPNCQMWMGLDMAPLLADPVRGRRTLTVLARRAEGRSQADVDAFLATFSSDLQRRYPVVHGRQTFVALPLRDELVGTTRPALIGAALAAALLLLIVVANIAGLTTAQAGAARHDLAVRMALGATRGRLFLEHLVDSLVVAVTGTVAGLWLASALVRMFAGRQRQFLERLAPVRLDVDTLIAGVAMGVTVGVVAALVPRGVIGAISGDGLQASRGEAGGARASRLRSMIVVGQVALTVVMIISATLLMRSVDHLTRLPLGFDPEGLTTFTVNLPGERYASAAAQVAFEEQMLPRLAALPGVRSATASVGVPVIGGMMAALAVHGRPASQELDEVAYFSVAPGFMATAGARLVAGRDLEITDRATAPPVVVINDTMARTFWPHGDALGARVQLGPGDPNGEWITVVGIVEDLRQHGPTERIRPTAFGSTRQYSWPRRNFMLRTEHDASIGLAVELRSLLRAVDPTLAIVALTPVTQLIGDRTAPTRLVRLVLMLFAVVALVLSASGLYAVVALTSRARRREYAIRLALGASERRVGWLVVGQSIGLAAVGAVLGLGAAAATTRALAGLLHGVAAMDPVSYGVAVSLLLALALVAAWRPARHAIRANPAEVLKAE